MDARGLSQRAVRVIVSGRVQGVGFRMFVEHEARTRGLSGWVRNRRDGRVEALIAGPSASVAEMIEACRRGPRASRVDEVSVEEASGTPPLGFSVLPTA